MTVSSGTQPESSDLQLESSSSNTIEAEIEPKYTDSSTQVMPEMISIVYEVPIAIVHSYFRLTYCILCMQLETQAKPEVHNFGVQCDLLSPMPMSLSHLPLTSTPIIV